MGAGAGCLHLSMGAGAGLSAVGAVAPAKYCGGFFGIPLLVRAALGLALVGLPLWLARAARSRGGSLFPIAAGGGVRGRVAGVGVVGWPPGLPVAAALAAAPVCPVVLPAPCPPPSPRPVRPPPPSAPAPPWLPLPRLVPRRGFLAVLPPFLRCSSSVPPLAVSFPPWFGAGASAPVSPWFLACWPLSLLRVHRFMPLFLLVFSFFVSLFCERLLFFLFNLLKFNTMAIVNRGFDQVNMHGSVGAVTYRRVDGRTIASQKVPAKSSARRTRSVMLQRMKWANLVAMWRALNVPGWHPSFPKDDPGVSDFNAFMSANLEAAGIYLPKGIQRSGAGVVSRTKVTEGGLSSIEVEFGSNSIAESDLALGTLSIGNSTTLGAFSQAIIANNEGWLDGDMLTVVIVRQLSKDGIPSLGSEFLQVKLNASDTTTLLSDVADVTLLSVADGCLALSSSLTGGCAMVHSRRLSDGSTSVSRQFLEVNNVTLISAYTGNNAFVAAAESYGGIAASDYLTPVPDDEVAADLNP